MSVVGWQEYRATAGLCYLDVEWGSAQNLGVLARTLEKDRNEV